MASKGFAGIRVLRAFRVLRLFKVFKYIKVCSVVPAFLAGTGLPAIVVAGWAPQHFGASTINMFRFSACFVLNIPSHAVHALFMHFAFNINSRAGSSAYWPDSCTRIFSNTFACCCDRHNSDVTYAPAKVYTDKSGFITVGFARLHLPPSLVYAFAQRDH